MFSISSLKDSHAWIAQARIASRDEKAASAADNVGKLEKEPIKGMIYEGRRGEDSRCGSTRDSVSTINR